MKKKLLYPQRMLSKTTLAHIHFILKSNWSLQGETFKKMTTNSINSSVPSTDNVTFLPFTWQTTDDIEQRGSDSMPVHWGFIAAVIAIIFYGVNYVPVKKFYTGDGESK